MRYFKAMRLLVRTIESENRVDKTRGTTRTRVRRLDRRGELRLLQHVGCKEDAG